MAKAKKTDAEPKAEYTVLARRYRPQQLGDLIGQEHVANALTNALNSGRVAHAYLFTGARGTGKTSCARILAKCLNCEKGPTPTPCDACDICKSIAGGDDVDVLEIDGASNNKVDEVRELRQNVGFRPTRARYKIYIIDEVHMLSTGAFNALLKTLEEPPAHVKFILATTEIQKIPITILSRCQRFDFSFVKADKIFEQLKKIVSKEGHQADDDALRIIARRAAGSMRDSQSLLDQLLAFSEGKLTAEKVHAVLGTAGDDRVAELADLILKKEAKGAVEKLQNFAESGLQMGELIDQLIDYWRGLMMVLTAGSSFNDLPGSPAFQEDLKKRAAGQNLDTILAGLDVLATTKARTRGSLHVGTLLEMAVVRLARLDELVSVANLISGAPLPTAKPAVTSEDSSKKNSPLSSESNNAAQPNTQLDSTDPVQILSFLREKLGPLKGSSLAQAGIPAIFAPNSLAFRFPNGYSSAYANCADDDTVRRIQEELQKLTGQTWQVRIEAGAGEAAEPSRPASAYPKAELLAKPLFEKITKALGGQLVKLDDGFQALTPGTDDPEDDAP